MCKLCKYISRVRIIFLLSNVKFLLNSIIILIKLNIITLYFFEILNAILSTHYHCISNMNIKKRN